LRPFSDWRTCAWRWCHRGARHPVLGGQRPKCRHDPSYDRRIVSRYIGGRRTRI